MTAFLSSASQTCFWDEHWSSEQQIMSRLAERCRVIYVERPVSILSSLTGVSDASIWRQWLSWLRGGLRQEGPNLTIVSPPPVLPLRYNAIVNRINAWLPGKFGEARHPQGRP